jgi:AcrR family transcriptional regulator
VTELTSALRRDAEANRTRLIAAAIDVFNSEGTDAGVEQIAARAGVGVGTLYRRFPTKDALIAYLVADLMAEMTDAATRARTVPDGGGLEQYVRELADRLAARRGCLDRLWNQGDPSERALLRRRLGQLVRDARQADVIRADITLDDMLRVIWSLQGVILNAGPAAAKACKRHLDIVFAGLRA